MSLSPPLSPGVYVNEVPSNNAPIVGVSTSTAGFVGIVPDTVAVPDYSLPLVNNAPQAPSFTVTLPVGQVALLTTFTDFKNIFGDFSNDPGQSALAHAVFGFFNNGGTRCYVTRITPPSGSGTVGAISSTLDLFNPIDEISLVAAPFPNPNGPPALSYTIDSTALAQSLSDHCKNLQSCFAILDSQSDYTDFTTQVTPGHTGFPADSDYTALYFPWIQVFDPATRARKFIAPSGHVAGVYARVDNQRGVHKAPANEPVQGALGLKYAVSRAQQDGLNPVGVNCIRNLNGNIRIWGARTRQISQTADFKYVSTRRLFIFLRESINAGIQWAVFEPNNADLWAKITRNVGAFLKQVWSAGALFGATPEEAFFVKCDAETNPPAVRDAGQVITQIGVAVTKPAEFVIFNIGQKISQ